MAGITNIDLIPKFHQVYARALKIPEGQRLAQNNEKWKIGEAVHRAIRILRTKGE